MSFQDVCQRLKNPINWVLGMILFGVFVFSLWDNDITQSIVIGIAMLPSWFLFPKPKRTIKWVSKVVDAGVDWWQKPMSFDKAISYVVGLGAFSLFVYTLWLNDYSHAVMSFAILVFLKASVLWDAFRS